MKRLLSLAAILLSDVVIGCGLAAIAVLIAIALESQHDRESAMERVHTAGMVAGLQLCPGSER